MINKQEDLLILPRQYILLIDASHIYVTATCFFKITNEIDVILNVKDWRKSLELVCLCLLRDAVGYNTFDTFQMNKSKIEEDMAVNNILFIFKID